LEATVGIDFNPLLAVLLIVWGTLAVGAIPVLLAWRRIADHRHITGQRELPKALWALTASICIDQAGYYIFRAPIDWSRGTTFPVYLILYGVFALGFLLNLAALVLALRERNVARNAVLTGSIAVAVVNVLGFAWLLGYFHMD
jgi:hypothetical protein